MSADIHGGAQTKRRAFTAIIAAQLVIATMAITAIISGAIGLQGAVPLLIALYGVSLGTMLWQSGHTHEELEQLHAATEEELKQAHARRLKDVSDATKRMMTLAQELENTRMQKHNIEQVKSDFLGHISHEIRTPLNAVVGMAELLSRTPLTADQLELVGLINSSGETLLSVINDILNYSKIEAGEFNLEKAEFDLNELVEGTAQLLSESARLRQVWLSTFIAPTLAHGYFGDAGRLKQILVNLLGNALRFAQPGEILLSAEEDPSDPESVRFSVKDSSSSMSKSVVSSLFSPLTEVDMMTARKHGGTGLGLSVSKKLVELMQGSMGVDSSPEKGTTFWFTAKLQAAPSSQDSGNFGVGSVTRRKLMIVGKASLSVAVVVAYARSWGIDCEYEPVAQDALTKMKNRPLDYQAVLLEPGSSQTEDVLELLKELAVATELEETQAIILSEDEATDQQVKAIECTTAILRKPFRKAQLHDALRQCQLSLRRTGEIVRPETQLKSLVASVDFATRNCDNSTDQSEARSNQNPNDENTGVAAKNILVVEDNPVNRRLVNLQLKALGLTCDNVENGQEAIRALQAKDYKLILMDCWMPVLDGFAATAEIRKSESCSRKHTAIVAMTANAMDSDRADCIAAGMDDYISKPVTTIALKDMLDKWLT